MAFVPGWPTDRKAGLISTPDLALLSLSEDLAVIGVDSNGRVHALDSMAITLPGWPASLPSSSGQAAACTVDIDQDGRDEVFASSWDAYYGLSSEGEILRGWPEPADDPRRFPTVVQDCTVADLEGDGPYEVIGSSRDRLSVWDQTGRLKDGWPVFLPPNSELTDPDLVPATRLALPVSVADLDGDGFKEVVVATLNGFLHVFSHDGRELSGFPFNFDPAISFGPVPIVWETPLADLDGDGDLEIIAAVSIGSLGLVLPRLWVFHHDGSIMDGYPIELTADISGIALADLDGDGALWILAGVNDIHPFTFRPDAVMVWEAATGLSRPGFPAVAEAPSGTSRIPLVGDVTGDGNPDIVQTQRPFGTGSLLGIYAWDRFGEPIQPFPLASVTGIEFTAGRGGILADIDRDGQVDILFPGAGRLIAATFNRPYDPRTLEWPMLNRDPQRSGHYRPPVDQLDLLGKVQPGRMVLAGPVRDVEIPLRLRGQRLALAEALLAGGLSLVAINDREIEPIPVTLRRDGPATLDLDGATTLGLVAGLDGEAVRAAVRQRLERAGACPGPGHVRLELATPTVDRRRVAGQMRLEGIFVPDRERPGCRS